MGRREDMVALVEQALGPVRWHHHDTGVVEVDGQSVVVEMATARGAREVKELIGVRIGVPLNDRPVRLAVDSTELGRSSGKIPTGDAAFDDAMEVEGWPAEVCVAALDAGSRRYLVEAFDRRWPYLETEDGQLRMTRRLVDRGSRPDAEPAEVAEMARQLVALADRLIDAYDDARAEVQRSQGDAAAEAFDQAQRARWDAHLSRRGRVRLVVGLAVLVVVVAVTYFVLSPLL